MFENVSSLKVWTFWKLLEIGTILSPSMDLEGAN